MTQIQKLLSELKKQGFTIGNADIAGAYTAQIYTPAGEDWNIAFMDVKDFIQQAQYFDVEEELEIWLEAKRNGVQGVPSVSELLADQEWKRDTLQEIAQIIK